MPLSSATSISRPDIVFNVGALSSSCARLLAQPASTSAAQQATTLRLGRFIRVPGQRGAVVQLRDGESGLGRVRDQTFLLAVELGHRELLHLALLLDRQRGDLRD